MNNQRDILKQLASGAPSIDREFDAEETLGNSWIERKEMFMQRSKGLAKDVRLAAFQDEMKDYHFTNSNVDSYYDTYAELFPGSAQEAENHSLNTLLDEVSSLPDDISKANWAQENRSRVPTKWNSSFGEYFKRLREKEGGQMEERTRLTSVIAADKKYESLAHKNINTSKAGNAHKRDIIKADINDLLDTLEVDDEGDFTVNTAEGRRKANTLEDTRDPITTFIAWHDLSPGAAKFVSQQMEQSLTAERAAYNLTTGQMRKAVASFPEDFQANTIVDYALMQDPEKPSPHMRGALREIVSADINAGKLTSPDEIVWKYRNKRDDVLNSYSGRRLNGT